MFKKIQNLRFQLFCLVSTKVHVTVFIIPNDRSFSLFKIGSISFLNIARHDMSHLSNPSEVSHFNQFIPFILSFTKLSPSPEGSIFRSQTKFRGFFMIPFMHLSFRFTTYNKHNIVWII